MEPCLLIKHREWGKYASKFSLLLHWKPHAWWCVIIAYSGPSWVIFKSCADNMSPCLDWWWQLPVNHELVMTHHQNLSCKMSWWWLIFTLLLIIELVITPLQTLHNIEEIGTWLIILLYRQKESSLPSLPSFCQ